MFDSAKRWWLGEYVPPPPNDPESSVWILSAGHYRRHWTSRLAHAIVEFYLKEWKWLIPVVLGILFFVLGKVL